jgi:glutathione S-transferase
MSRYKLHCFGQSGNSYKVALYLECAGLDWEPVFTDFFKGRTRDAEWRQGVNEMGEAPVLEIDGRRLSQSGVILTYLADKTGKFRPVTEDDRLEALRWMLFDNHKFTGYLATYRFLKAFLPQAPSPDVLALLKGRFESALGIVEKHLGKTRFIVGDEPTIADFSLAGYMFYPPEEAGYDWPATSPNVAAWIERMRGLPGWKGPYALMPGERISPLR